MVRTRTYRTVISGPYALARKVRDFRGELGVRTCNEPASSLTLERRTQARRVWRSADNDVMNDTARLIEDHRTLRNGSGAQSSPPLIGSRVVGLHQGQRTPSAPTGRTYDRRPQAVHRRNKNACQGAVHI